MSEDTNATNATKARALREQAATMMKEAAALDGFQATVALHESELGDTVCIFWSKNAPMRMRWRKKWASMWTRCTTMTPMAIRAW